VIDSELDAIYTHLCKTMTELGEPNALLFLSRFALLAIDRLDDGETAIQLIEAAAEDVIGTQVTSGAARGSFSS
jgi:hypothetical protein